MGEQGGGWLFLHHLAGIHHLHALRRLGHHAHVVGDQHQTHAVVALQPDQQVQHALLHCHVQRRGGLVGDQQAGLQAMAMAIITRWFSPPDSWCGNDAHAAAPARGCRPGPAAPAPGAHVAPGHGMVGAQRLADLPADRVAGVERGGRLLEHHRHIPPHQPAAGTGRRACAVPLSLNAMRLGADPAGGGSSPMTASTETLLPEPDSPTTHSTSPGATVRSTDSTALNRPRAVSKATERCVHLQQRAAHLRNFGSSASRSPSPSRLNAMTVTRIARPGKVSSHQARL